MLRLTSNIVIAAIVILVIGSFYIANTANLAKIDRLQRDTTMLRDSLRKCPSVVREYTVNCGIDSIIVYSARKAWQN